MRAYVYTNILYFMLLRNEADIDKDVRSILEDADNIMSTSTVCVHELLHLCQIGKIPLGRKNGQVRKASDIIEWLHAMDIDIVNIEERHLAVFATMPLYEDHRDPNDRLIIAQAITDKIPLISSDLKFKRYVKNGLDFIYNKR